MSGVPRACVIGAGSSGIAVAKTFAERGIPFDCYERGDRVGGNWVFGNRNGMSAAYDTLRINTSRERMEYADFPMPKSYPDYAHHTEIAAYFDAYVDHFGFRDRITFRTTVERAQRRDGGGWLVVLDDGRALAYDMLVVANGHHWDARWPEPPFPGTFDGLLLHAHGYTDRSQLEGRDVVVLGMGNSAMDIAVEASACARSVTLAARRGAHVVPKYLFGRPTDQIAGPFNFPFPVRRALLAAVYRLAVGRVEDYGLPKPDHRLLSAHPTLSDGLLDRVRQGRIQVKPNIARLAGDRVEFVDGSSVPADLVVFATGYRITFPFLDPDVVSAPDNRIGLYHRVFEPTMPDLAFVGLAQPLGAIMPIAEAQARWIASYLLGEYALPSRAGMDAEIGAYRAGLEQRYVSSERHTIQVDFDDYLRALGRERRAGERRARLAGWPLPVPGQVADLEVLQARAAS
jgi:cation diffusion facilitator CzcD-associated flavoprotein CzcO